MSEFTIEITPKKSAFDPLAHRIKDELIEAGENPADAVVNSIRLYRIQGEFSSDEIKRISEELLVDPVVENWSCPELTKSKKIKPSSKGVVVDVWLKPGVTDPVGETIEKALNDLGFFKTAHAHSALRYVFPKISDTAKLKNLAKQTLANELIHDIHIRKNDA